MFTHCYSVGFGETDITPRLPVLMSGYYYERKATAIHDRLYARAMAVADERQTVVLCIADLIGIPEWLTLRVRARVKELCGLSAECLILGAVHSHTAPDMEQEKAYSDNLPELIAQSVRQAVEDLKPRSLKVGRSEVPGIQFIRRYRMKDGTVRTNPGLMNPDIVAPIGTPDPTVSALMAYEGDQPVGGVVHFALHSDTTGELEVSADWSYYLRQRMCEASGAKLHILTPIGPAGDVNHWDVFHKDDTPRGYEGHTRRLGEQIATGALAALSAGDAVPAGAVRAALLRIELPVRVPSVEELAEAQAVLAKPAPHGIDFTMDRVEAGRRLRAAEAGPGKPAEIIAFTFGSVGIVGLPVEYFTELGRWIKNHSPQPHTLVCTLCTAYNGYVAERQNYAEGGYETTSSIFAPGTGEIIAETSMELLKSLKQRA